MADGVGESDVRALMERLRSALEQSESRTANLDDKCRSLARDLEERKAGIPEEEGKEAKLQRELQDATKQLHELQGTTASLKRQLSLLQDERDTLNMDLGELLGPVASQHKEDEAKLQQHIADTEEYMIKLRRENSANEELKEKMRITIAQYEDDVESMGARAEKLSQKLAMIQNVPVRTRKQCNVIEASFNLVEDQLLKSDEQYNQIRHDITAAKDEAERLRTALEECGLQLLQAEHERENMKRRHQHSLKEVEQYKEAATGQLGDRALYDTKRRLVEKELKSCQDLLTRKLREKEKLQKHLRQSETKEEQLGGLCTQLTNMKAKVHAEIEAEQKRAIEIGESTDKLETEFQGLQKQWEGRLSSNKDAMAQVSAATAKIRELEKELVACSRKSFENVRRIAQLQQAVDNASNDRIKAERMRAQAEDQRKSSTLGLRDGSKSVDATIKTLKNVEGLYNVVKNEKNVCLSQINTSQQKQMEMRDKARILSTEIEILRGSAIDKDEQLQQQRSSVAGMVLTNDTLRAEVNQLAKKESQLLATLESTNNAKEKLDLIIKALESKHDAAKRDRARVIAERDDLIKTLNARSHELSTHYEMQHMQSSMLKDIEVAIQASEENLRFLRLESKQLVGHIAALKKKQDSKQTLEEELVSNQEALAEVQRKVEALEKKLTSPAVASRWREMQDKEEDPHQLEMKLHSLSDRLAEREERSLELDLLAEETDRLCQRAEVRLEGRKTDSVTITKTATDYKARIGKLTKKLMATVSELSMYQAKALQLQKQLEDKQQTLASAEERMAQGLPPSAEIEEEWLKSQRRLDQTRRDREREEEDNNLEGEHLRPNAYVPDAEGSLPVPKPFGPHAPFKPSAPPAHMRHFRRSVQTSQSKTTTPQSTLAL